MLHLDMGKHAFYVWGSWGLSAVVLGALILHTWRQAKAAAAELGRREGETAR